MYVKFTNLNSYDSYTNCRIDGVRIYNLELAYSKIFLYFCFLDALLIYYLTDHNNLDYNSVYYVHEKGKRILSN